MRFTRPFRIAAIVGALSLTAASQVSAHAVSAVTDPNNWTFGGAAQLIVPNMTSAVFANLANQTFIVHFAAECAVAAPAGNFTGWLDVDIVVLNALEAVVQTLAPTVGAGDAFCSSNGTAAFDGWSSNAVIAVGGANLPAGNYRVQVRARLNNGATGGWLGERTLLVTR